MSTAMDLRVDPPCRPLHPRRTEVRSPFLRAALPAAQYRHVAAGTTIYDQGEAWDDVYVVVQGWAFLHHILEDGRRQILDFLLPGDACGSIVETHSEATHTAEALTDATVAVYPRAQIGAVLATSPELAMSFLARAASALASARDLLVDVGRRNALEAVAHLLIRLDGRVRSTLDGNEAAAIDFPLTQEHIGDALGLTAVHVCRTLRALREIGAATLTRGHLTVLDRSRLIEIAGISAFDLDGELAQHNRFRSNGGVRQLSA